MVFGNGCAMQSAEFLAQRGAKRVLLVTSKSVRPQIAFLVEALKNAGCEVVEAGFISSHQLVKILGKGELTLKLDVTANAFSASAIKAIEAVGGTATVC